MAKKINLSKLAASIVVCQLAGLVGSFATTPSIPTWYAGLNKPWFNPPNWIFGPVWGTLFLLMGISLYLVWNRKVTVNVKEAMIVFGIQLILNIFWSVFFFGLQKPALAFLEIIVLLAFIILTIIKFRPISKISAWLLAPYLLWVSFASVLNFYIAALN